MSDVPHISLAPDDAEVVIRASDREFVLDIPEGTFGRKLGAIVKSIVSVILFAWALDWIFDDALLTDFHFEMTVALVASSITVFTTRRKRLYLDRKEGTYLLTYKPFGIPLFFKSGDLDRIASVDEGGHLPLALVFRGDEKLEIGGLTSRNDRRWAKEQIEAFLGAPSAAPSSTP